MTKPTTPSREARERRVRIKWEPHDLWVGVYRDPANRRIYVCIVPCLPFIIHSPFGQRILGLLAAVLLMVAGVFVSKLMGGWSVGDYWTLGLGATIVGALVWAIPEIKRAPKR